MFGGVYDERRGKLISLIEQKSTGSAATHGGPDYNLFQDMILLELLEEVKELRQRVIKLEAQAQK